MQPHCLAELTADGQHRIQCCHGFLEHHGQMPAAQAAAGPRIQHVQIAARIVDAPCHLFHAVRQQTHERQRGERFAAAGFAEQGERLAACEPEAHTVDRMHTARAQAQIADRDQHLAHMGVSCGSNCCRHGY